MALPTIASNYLALSRQTATPLIVPPSGVTPNLTKSKASNADEVYIAAIVCCPIIVLAGGLRVYVKLRVSPKWTIADYFSILSILCTLGFIGVAISLEPQGSFSHHLWDLTPIDLSNTAFLIFLLLETLYGPVIYIIKVSLLLLYLNAFRPNILLRYCVWIGITVIGLFYFSVVIAEIAMCAPRNGNNYVHAIIQPRCGNVKDIGLVASVFNVVSDTYLLIIPIPAVWALQVTRKRKIGLTVVFGTGLIALFSSIVSLVNRAILSTSSDTTWNVIPIYLALIVEMTAGIMVLGAPPIHSILKAHSSRFRNAMSSSKSRPQPGSLDVSPLHTAKHQHGGSAYSEMIQQLIDSYSEPLSEKASRDNKFSIDHESPSENDKEISDPSDEFKVAKAMCSKQVHQCVA